MVRGFAAPVTANSANCIALGPDELIGAQATLLAKRKRTRTLSAKCITEKPTGVGDLVELHTRLPADKRGSWSSLQVVLGVNLENWTVTVPAFASRTMKGSFEDIRPAIHEDSFAQLVLPACDALDVEVEALPEEKSTLYIDFDEAVAVGASLNDHNGTTYTADKPFVPTVGDAIEVFWPDDNHFYSGTVSAVDSSMYTVDCNDGDQEMLDMTN